MTEPQPTKKSYAAQAAWRDRNPLKRWAHIATASAIRRGLLTPRGCEVCGAEPAEAHHEDHANPLDVRWFCRKHHKAHHAAQNAAKEAQEAGE